MRHHQCNALSWAFGRHCVVARTGVSGQAMAKQQQQVSKWVSRVIFVIWWGSVSFVVLILSNWAREAPLDTQTVGCSGAGAQGIHSLECECECATLTAASFHVDPSCATIVDCERCFFNLKLYIRRWNGSSGPPEDLCQLLLSHSD